MKHRIYKLITIIFLIYQLFPPIWYYTPVSGAIVLALYVGSTMMLFPILLTHKSVIFLIIYTFITFLFFMKGNTFFDTYNSVIVPFLTVSSALLLVGYTLLYADISFIKTVIYTTFILLITISIISIPQIHMHPNIIRGASVYAAGTESGTEYYWVIGYGVIHGISVIFAPLGFLIKKDLKKNKFINLIWLVITLILLYIVYLSNATTALIISILSLSGGILINFNNFSRKNIFKTMLIGVILILLFNKTTIVMVLDNVQPLFNESGSNYKKISNIKDYFIYGDADGSIGARETLYESSFQLFYESPLIGTARPEKIGYHSYFLDRLAALGMLFTIPLILTFWSHIKSVYKRLDKTKVIYSIGCFCYLLMLFLKNEFGSGSFLFAFAILPIFCIYIDNVLCNNVTLINGNKSISQKG